MNPQNGIAENGVQRDVAVIDVGSNTVRLVHFRLEGRALWPVYNEKVMAGLGNGVAQSGQLNPDGVLIAKRALKRFQRLLDTNHISERHLVATAAVRNADDGAAFVADIAEHCGFDIQVLSGEDEGDLSAAGLICGIPNAHGVMGDLGGSSLELTRIESGQPSVAQTFALGPQEALKGAVLDRDPMTSLIDLTLKEASSLQRGGGDFYAIGGAWRALAQIAFSRLEYPLHVVHQFRLTGDQVLALTEFVVTADAAALGDIDGVPSRRTGSLPFAALLLQRLVALGRCDGVVFSAYGLREGVLIKTVAPMVREIDPLVAGCEAMARPVSPASGFGRAVALWIAPALNALDPVFDGQRDGDLIQAACRLIDLGARMHPDHRVGLVRNSVLYAPIANADHVERVFLAAVLHFRYGGGERALLKRPAFAMLCDAQMLRARFVGLILRLAAKVSGRSCVLLERFSLQINGGCVRLEVDEQVRDLYVERSASLVNAAAHLIGHKSDVHYR